ncbi:WW domain-containing protein [Meloidogyne graminicola]|uniref:WW domain-containing protein n=1 Tax=Meloidogyne graminicola TaxID=189291 RepID=A0A8T0A0Y3_9BILA|nr:WW domain-containing protein [Meloidogyne graminicola]
MDSSPTIARLKEFGTWTEQTSSSGKRYYYNSATNISQWEKPTEWKHAEKLRASASSLKNGSSNGGHPSVVQQMPKVTKPVVENEKGFLISFNEETNDATFLSRFVNKLLAHYLLELDLVSEKSRLAKNQSLFNEFLIKYLYNFFEFLILVSSSLPSIRIPHHHQPNLYKQSTPTVSSSTPTSSPTFRPGISTPLSVRTIPTSSAPQILSTPSSSSFQQLKRPLEKSPSSINDSLF